MNRICIGIIMCDNYGAFVLAKYMSFSPLSYVLVCEALGLFNVIEWLSNMQLNFVDFVVDF